MTREKVSKFLEVSKKRVTNLVKHRGLPCKKLGKEYRFLKSEVLNWMRTQGSGMTGKETN